MRLSPSNTRDKRQIRPYTTDLTSNHRCRANSVTPDPRPQSMKAKLCRDEPKKENSAVTRPCSVDIKFEQDDEPPKKTTGKMVTSPRKEKEHHQTEETTPKRQGSCVHSIINEIIKKEGLGDASEEQDEACRMEKCYSGCLEGCVQDSTGVDASKEPSHRGISSVTVISRNTELKRRPFKSPRHLRCGPTKKPYFVNSPRVPTANGPGMYLFCQ